MFRPVYTAHLGGRASAGLLVLTIAAIASVAAALAGLFAARPAVIVWCRDFILAASDLSTGAMAAAAGAALLVIAGARATVTVVREAAGGARLRRDILRRGRVSSGKLDAARSAAGVAAPVLAVRDEQPYAFTVGALRPLIIVSSALVSRLSLNELRAVLAHEGSHRAARDPLKAFLWEIARASFFFLPSIRDVAEHFALRRELAADRAAVAASGRRALASALLKAVDGGVRPHCASFSPFGHLSSRVEALGRGRRGARLRLSIGRAAVTAASVIALAATNAVAAGGPRPSVDAAEACRGAAASNMSVVNFSPYLRIRMETMSPAPPSQSPAVAQ